MAKFNRFIIPLALTKILLVFLVMHLFFASCSDDELYYSSDLYTDGAVVEMQACFGEGKGGFLVGDTIYLQIAPSSFSMKDQLSDDEVKLRNAKFEVAFAFANADDGREYPKLIVESGKLEAALDTNYEMSFSNIDTTEASDNEAKLRVGVVFAKAGNYSLYFINTPNTHKDGGVNVHYNYDFDAKEFKKHAYAKYFFDLDDKSRDYADGFDTDFRLEMLYCADFNEGIMDFTIVESN